MSDPTAPLPPLYEIHHMPGLIMVQRPRRRYWLHALLLGATIFTTLVVGARLEFNFLHHLPPYASEDDLFPFGWALSHPSRLLLGVPFSGTLMLILLAHEMGHFIASVRYRVFATLPFFIPAPTLIGTLGAFIRIKSPIPSRRALFDIGIAGPIAGFVLAVPAMVVALRLSQPVASLPESELQFSFPLVFVIAQRLLRPGVPLGQMLLHPMAIAAWVGMFATALNLLPGGQLDGGHIVYALWPRAHRWISLATTVTLLVGMKLWLGWVVWAMMLLLSGTRHPQIVPRFAGVPGAPYEDPWPELGAGRAVLALCGLAMLILTLMPAPFPGAGLDWGSGG